MEPLYKFIPASEDNLPTKVGDYTCLLQAEESEYAKSLLWDGEHFHEYENEGIEYEEPCDNVISWLKEVTIPDDWEEEFENEFLYRECFVDADYCLQVIDWIKSNLLAPLKGEDRDDIDTSNNKERFCLDCKSQRVKFLGFLPNAQLWVCSDCGERSVFNTSYSIS
jgi:hypothetical protein